MRLRDFVTALLAVMLAATPALAVEDTQLVPNTNQPGDFGHGVDVAWDNFMERFQGSERAQQNIMERAQEARHVAERIAERFENGEELSTEEEDLLQEALGEVNQVRLRAIKRQYNLTAVDDLARIHENFGRQVSQIAQSDLYENGQERAAAIGAFREQYRIQEREQLRLLNKEQFGRNYAERVRERYEEQGGDAEDLEDAESDDDESDDDDEPGGSRRGR